MTPKLLHYDRHFIAVEKPSCLPTQPTPTSDDDLLSQTVVLVRKLREREGPVYIHPIHRLDAVVSGIVLFALSSKSLSRLNEALRNGEIERHYSACVEGEIQESANRWEDYLYHDEFKKKAVIKAFPFEGAKRASLSFKVVRTISQTRPLTLIEIDLETGRYHQIRAQCAAHGYPILGDHYYGSRYRTQNTGIALHHSRMTFPHPITGEIVAIHSPFDESKSNF